VRIGQQQQEVERKCVRETATNNRECVISQICTYFSTTSANENWPRAVRTYAPSNVRCAARISTSLFTVEGSAGVFGSLWGRGRGGYWTHSCAVRITLRARCSRNCNLSSGCGSRAFSARGARRQGGVSGTYLKHTHEPSESGHFYRATGVERLGKRNIAGGGGFMH
jgi:hypothetical protein